jgi:hypothetical protein
MAVSTRLLERCRKLGLTCDEVATDHISSPLAALACFPMYMVANVHAWASDKQFRVPIVDLPGSEHIREAFAIGKQESSFAMEKEHRRVLGTLVSHAKPSDLVIYEYALETLKDLLLEIATQIAEKVRAAVARMIVAVAQASGEGFLGTGPKISPEENACIMEITNKLSLQTTPASAAILKAVL